MAKRPAGKVEISRFEPIPMNACTLRAKVICTDAAGQEWYFFAHEFYSNLMPVFKKEGKNE